MTENPIVLVIEDNAQNRYLVTFLLEQRGYRVVAEIDGAAGVEKALSVLPVVILLDIQLPGRDGHAVARELRTHAGLDGTPIIAVTSYAMPGDEAKALASGCNGYIEKPIDPSTFVSQIERAMQVHRESR